MYFLGSESSTRELCATTGDDSSEGVVVPVGLKYGSFLDGNTNANQYRGTINRWSPSVIPEKSLLACCAFFLSNRPPELESRT